MFEMSEKEERAIRSLYELNLKGDKELREFSTILIDLIQRLENEIKKKDTALNNFYDIREG